MASERFMRHYYGASGYVPPATSGVRSMSSDNATEQMKLRIAELEQRLAAAEKTRDKWYDEYSKLMEIIGRMDTELTAVFKRAEAAETALQAAREGMQEECAKLCDERFNSYTNEGGRSSGVFAMESWNCAAAIRAIKP